MNQEEIFEEMQRRLMNDEVAASLWEFSVGDAFDDHFSRVSVTRLIMYVCSCIYALVGVKLDDWQREVNATADETRYGTEAWWKEQVLGFQYGHSVEVIDGRMGYAEDDAEARIVTAATIATVGRTLSIKVAKGAAGSREALDDDELEALQSYVNAIKPVGITADVTSGSAGTVALTATVTYSGQRTRAVVEEEVEAAIGRVLGDLAFGGTLYSSAIIDAVLAVDGVDDMYISTITLDGETFQGAAVPPAGYAILGTSTINYIAR